MEAITKNIKSENQLSKKKRETRNRNIIINIDIRNHYRRILDRLLNKIRKYIKDPDIQLLRKAYQFAYQAHINQLRKSGKPYIEHCLETAKILVELKMDVITIAAGLLHDVVEDTGVNIEAVREAFGNEVAQLVDGVTKISELKFHSHAEEQAENFRKMIFSMAYDLRVILIKFADRLHNMRTLEYLPKKKAKRIALETREIYAPLAHRFGIAKTKWELEDLSLKVLEPDNYYELVHKVTDRRTKREKYIRRMAAPIRRELTKSGIKAEITGRAKSLYSIYRKMQKRKKPFEDINDLLAIRIIVDKVDECYFALGIVHTIFTPVHDRFKDYIATPKLNMYQSLHTTVIGSDGKMVEIQIRTREMHRVAEVGIAAHWKYKEGRSQDDEIDRYSAWLREMIDLQKDTRDPEEYLDILKTDLFHAEIFVFTPKGDLLKLPRGSTPVDFAFTVHTDIGLHCIGAKVNGRIVPLATELKNGDSIEIITSANQKPSKDWLNFVKTSKAKARIKRWLKEAKYQEAIKLGEEILTKEMKRYRIRSSGKELHDLAIRMKFPDTEHFYANLGEGKISLQKVIGKLAPDQVSSGLKEKKDNVFDRFISRARGSVKGVRVQGMDNFLIRFAGCCHPVPGDSIIGFISKGRGIIIHRRDCINTLNLMQMPERNIEVSWDVAGEESFLVQLRIQATDRKHFFKDIAESLATMNTNIMKAMMNAENSLVTAHLILEVKNLSHLTRIIRQLHHVQGVLSVQRDSGIMQTSEFH